MKKKKEVVTKVNKARFAIHFFSAFMGLIVTLFSIDLMANTGYSGVYIVTSVLGAYVLVANFHQMFLLLKGEKVRK